MRVILKGLGVVIIITLAILTLSRTQSTGATGALVTIRSDRPRLLIDGEDLARVRSSLNSYGRTDFIALKNFALRRLADTSAVKLAASDPKQVASVVLVGLLANDTGCLKLAVSYAVNMARTSPGSGDDTLQRNRLLSMAYVYDWLQSYLSVTEKTTIKEGIIAHIKHLRYFLDKPLYTGGHSRYGCVTIMAGLIALSEQDWSGERDRLLETIRDQWETGYNPFQQYVAQEGGYHMGWRYGPGYTDPLPYLFWEKATGVRWGEEWRKQQIYWLMYGVRGDGTFPRSGDSWDTSIQDDNISAIAAVSSGMFKNRHAEWFYRSYFANNWEPRRLFRLLFQDPSVSPLSPADSLEELPLARQFLHAGFVVAKDTWDKNATQFVFKSSLFYSRNHHHKDQNHIELSYKGSLLIDSGSYEPPGFGSSHWKNYYTRTIAHNTMVVFDPTERFIDYESVVSNDGGQQFPKYLDIPAGAEPRDLTEALSQKYKLDGIIKFEAKQNYCWTRGDATKAYNSSKVTSYVRDILMVNKPSNREHPYVIILDRVQLKKALQPIILFHFNQLPITQDNYFGIQNNGGGYLHGEVLLPKKASLTLVGGKGSRWKVDGKDYDVEKPSPFVDAGFGRLEIGSGGSPAKNETFLFLLSVDDKTKFIGRPQATLISNDHHYGVLDGSNLLVINVKVPSATQWVFSGSQYNSVKTIYIAGVDPNKKYIFTINGKDYEVFSNTEVVHVAIP